MDKNAIKKFAVWARTELIARVSLKGVEYGITEDNIVDAAADSINGKVLTDAEKKQRQALIAEINDKGYKQVMEEVAYTWFNRFSALRFMEVNGYLPSHVRVFTDEENNFKPQIITEAIHLYVYGLDMEKIYELKEAEKTEELYKYLLIVQCNALNKILPGMFQKISDYTELLLPDNLLRDGSVIQQMIELIPEDDWKDAVQIIGWLYQYYNSEKKDDVFVALKKNVKITKENIPAATQLFTPDWIVRYMVENSLGRLWLEGHPDAKNQLLPTEEEQSAYVDGNRDPDDSKWHYYLEEAEQEPEVQAQLAEIRKEYAALTPEQLKVIDPCSGSGHILAYMFDVLMKIYESYGYTTREAVASIVENNIYGLDIDDRAAQLAYFAVMMKARQYDRRFFSRGIQPQVYAIVESNHVDKFAVEYFCNGDAKLKEAMDTILSELHDAKEYGSILTVTQQDWSALYDRFAEITEDINMSRDAALKELLPLVQVAEALAQKYDVYITNPPYLGNKSMSNNIASYLKNHYDELKMDLFAVFIKKGFEMTTKHGVMGFMTPFVWMFISSFSELRSTIIENGNITSLVQLEYSGFDGATVPICTYTLAKFSTNATGEYIKLSDFRGVDKQPLKTLEAVKNKNCQYRYSVKTSTFKLFPENVIAYWASHNFVSLFEQCKRLDDIYPCKKGMTTGDNNKFLRMWYEISNLAIGSRYKYYCKGGGYRRWYGNGENVIDWIDNGRRLREFKGATLRNEAYYFKKAVTWGLITSSKFSARAISDEYAIGDAGPICIPAELEYLYILAYLNSVVATYIMDFLNPTMNFSSGVIGSLPYIPSDKITIKHTINKLVAENVDITKDEWNDFETSWDFLRHPLLQYATFTPQMVAKEEANGYLTENGIADAYRHWEQACDERFNQLKANEEELNRIFIDIYGLQDELTPEVEDKDVTVRKADLGRDICSFISYAVGCMFGRYSPDVDGLAYAGGDWDASKYAFFPADKDNIIPICDDEYFEDDIVGLFVDFVKKVYGAETLDENLKFIADALGGKGQPKDVIRNYFLNDFYTDHCKIYQKRPIYWLFDSGKKNGFKALIYMHRYQPDTIARIRTDYVHEQQARYRTAIADLEQRIVNASTGERVKLNKKLTALQAQDAEIRTYEEKIHHLADQMISIDLDDGVKKNYAIFQDVLAKIK